MVSSAEIIEILKDKSGVDKISVDSDIYKDLSLTGDDFDELIDDFSVKYSVDMTNYLWYFHTNEEGDPGGLFFKPPYMAANRIAITPEILTRIANKGYWDIEYPEPTIPKRRNIRFAINLIFNKFSLTILCLFLLFKYILKFIKD